jgi:lipopolysaccharide transport system permease protein
VVVARHTPRSSVFWSQVLALTVANLRARYRKTWAGFVWVVLNPLILYGVQSQVFSRFLRLDIPNYALFLAAGLLPWIFITQSLEMTTSIFVWSGRLLKSYPIDPRVYLFAQVADNLVNFLGAFLLVLAPVAAWHGIPASRLAAIPLGLIPLVAGVTGLSWLLASLQVFYADVRFVLGFVIGVLFFLTPVFYPPEFVPPEWRWALVLNPFHRWIAPFQAALYEGQWDRFVGAWLESAAFGLVALGAAWAFWKRNRDAIYFRL